MSTPEKPRQHFLIATLNAVGGVSGLLALVSLSVFGGEMKRQQIIDTAEIEKLKKLPPVVEAHERMDDQRIEDMQRRIKVVEDAIIAQAGLRADVQWLRANMEWLIKQKIP